MKPYLPPVIVLHRDPDVVARLETGLKSRGVTRVIIADGASEVGWELQKECPLALLLGARLEGDRSALELVGLYHRVQPTLPIVVCGEEADLETGLRFMRAGAADYLVPPFDLARLWQRVQRERNRVLESCASLDSVERFTASIVTRDPRMLQLFDYCRNVAASPRPVLITGETGVGKELFAELLHRMSGRPGKLVAVNIAGLDDTLLSDTLFGHRRGAYTGAVDDRAGALEQAGGGTVLIDEIGDLSLSAQIKLLRLLQEQEYSPLGSDEVRRTEARIVLATHRDLFALQQEGRFRADLYYRIYTHRLLIPPLRERLDDLPLLLNAFIASSAAALHRPPPGYPAELLTLLRHYSFPGNIRELESMVFDAVSCCRSAMLSLDSFREHLESRNRPASSPEEPIEAVIRRLSRLPPLKSVTRLLIAEALRRSGGHQSLAARMLGITPQAINSRLRRLRSESKAETEGA